MRAKIGSQAQKDWKTNTKIHPLLAARFAFHLKKLRESRKQDLSACAKALDISIGYVSLLEAGKRCPSLEIVERTANYYGVDPAAMLGDPK